jgi:mannosidase alpha-like ER degradation enhancer 2
LSERTDFDANINVSVFETNIRIVGGLLSAHLLARKAGVKLETGWPCAGKGYSLSGQHMYFVIN